MGKYHNCYCRCVNLANFSEKERELSELELMTDSCLMMTKVKVKVTQSCLTLCNLSCLTGVLSDSSGHGIHQPGKNTGVDNHSLLQGIFQPRDGTQVSCIAGRLFTIWATVVDLGMAKWIQIELDFSQKVWLQLWFREELVSNPGD